MSSNNSVDDIHPYFFSPSCSYEMNIVKRTKLASLLESRKQKIYFGNVNLKDLEFKLKEGEKERDLGTFQNLSKDILLSTATVSPFGKGGETIVDLNVRNGLEIKADRFDPSFITSLESNQKLKNVLLEIQDTLFIHNIETKFVKLAIYTEGGHFQKHRDTPHAENHLATLLISAPLDHEGGGLVFYNNLDETYKWKSSGFDNCVAFFTDIVHEVKPITKGVRVVLQFDIFSKINNEDPVQKKIKLEDDKLKNNNMKSIYQIMKDYDKYDNSDDDNDDDNNKDEDEDEMDQELLLGIYEKHKTFQSFKYLDEIVEEVKRYCKSSPIALPLAHLYRNRSLTPTLLKGIDKELYLALEKAGFRVFVSQVIIYHTYFPDDDDFRGYEYTVSSCDPPSDIPKDLRWMNVNYIISGGSALHILQSQCYVEHTGNEAQEERYKYFGGIILVLPPL